MILSEQQLMELHHFAELGRLSASLIHEISNPLTAALLSLEVTDNSSAVQKARWNMQVLRRYVEAARQQLRLASRPVSFAVAPQIRQLKRLMLPLAKQARVELQFGSVPAGCRLFGDPVKFQQILANLVTNALQSYAEIDKSQPEPPLVRVAFATQPTILVITVTDWGMGIKPSDLPHIFEPHYSTKSRAGQGLGLGLAIVKRYVHDFAGSVKVSSFPARGTHFTINLPLKVN